MRNYSPPLLCLLILWSSVVVARDWKTPAGKLVYQGDFVALDQETVVVKTADGAHRTVALDKLCRDDQDFAREQEAARCIDPPKELIVKPQVSWDTITIQSSSETVSEAVVVVTLAAQSVEIAHASRVGDVKLEILETDAQPPLKLSENTPGARGGLWPFPITRSSIAPRRTGCCFRSSSPPTTAPSRVSIASKDHSRF